MADAMGFHAPRPRPKPRPKCGVAEPEAEGESWVAGVVREGVNGLPPPVPRGLPLPRKGEGEALPLGALPAYGDGANPR
jgi:hypothetical protein